MQSSFQYSVSCLKEFDRQGKRDKAYFISFPV
jgi:hypothetical protein